MFSSSETLTDLKFLWNLAPREKTLGEVGERVEKKNL